MRGWRHSRRLMGTVTDRHQNRATVRPDATPGQTVAVHARRERWKRPRLENAATCVEQGDPRPFDLHQPTVATHGQSTHRPELSRPFPAPAPRFQQQPGGVEDQELVEAAILHHQTSVSEPLDVADLMREASVGELGAQHQDRLSAEGPPTRASPQRVPAEDDLRILSVADSNGTGERDVIGLGFCAARDHKQEDAHDRTSLSRRPSGHPYSEPRGRPAHGGHPERPVPGSAASSGIDRRLRATTSLPVPVSPITGTSAGPSNSTRRRTSAISALPPISSVRSLMAAFLDPRSSSGPSRGTSHHAPGRPKRQGYPLPLPTAPTLASRAPSGEIRAVPIDWT